MQLAPRNSTVKDREQWWEGDALKAGQSMCFSEGGTYIRVDIERKSLFQQNHCNVHWQGSLPCCGEKEKSTFRNSTRYHVVGAQGGNQNMTRARLGREAEDGS